MLGYGRHSVQRLSIAQIWRISNNQGVSMDPLIRFSLTKALCLFLGAASVCNLAAIGTANTIAETQAASGCPVTSPDEAFTPPAPYRSGAPPGMFYFGTPKLWTLIGIHFWQARKLPWWTTANLAVVGSPPLTVSLRRLDIAGMSLVTDHANLAFLGDRKFMTTGFRTPVSAGCWEVIGKLNAAELRYVVLVRPD